MCSFLETVLGFCFVNSSDLLTFGWDKSPVFLTSRCAQTTGESKCKKLINKYDIRYRTWKARSYRYQLEKRIKCIPTTFGTEHSKKIYIYIHTRITLHRILRQHWLTVAKSFWVRPFSCLPCWMTLPTSSGTLSWCNSSDSRSSLAVFFVTRCCLFCPADPEWQVASVQWTQKQSNKSDKNLEEEKKQHRWVK